ncbi:MAG: hypothetical protein Pg6B_04790 [Candidatus Azobacteroides pseudotrichonymphae]|nr:MAG: hypothetical protein Pg6B_04790 [Candidatus Azobacteroides pseudotrichonymphae]
MLFSVPHGYGTESDKFRLGISPNIPVVCDVFAVAIKELCSNSSGGQNVPTKNHTKGRSLDCGFS